jgi:hypothetical protein
VFRGGNKFVGYAIMFLVFAIGIVLTLIEPVIPYDSFTSLWGLDITTVGVLTLSSGLFLNGFLIRNKFIHINNITPGFLLILFLTGLPNQASQVYVITSVFLMVLLIRKFTSIHNTKSNYITVFEIGVILGIIAIITPQFSGIVFLAIIGLTLVKTYSWRDFVIPILGICFVVFLKGAYNFMFDKPIDLFTIIDIHFYKPKFNAQISISQIVLSGITVIEFFFIYNLFNVVESKNIRQRVHYWLWIWLSVFLLFSMFFMQSPVNEMEIILLIGLPVSVFSKEFLDASMKSWQRDLTMILLIVGVLSLRFIPLF